MPGTWAEVSEALNLRASVYDPKANAIAAAYYMGKLGQKWILKRRDIERLRLAQASYNGGLGNVLAAQKRCNDALLWKDIEPCVTARETREYVTRIAHWYFTLTGRRE
jgi:membrane-bound lytic murein transglycosylase F